MKDYSDPRGPVRTITAIEERTDATLLTLDCGHVGRFNQIFHYKLGNPVRCHECNNVTCPVCGRQVSLAVLGVNMAGDRRLNFHHAGDASEGECAGSRKSLAEAREIHSALGLEARLRAVWRRSA